MYVKLYTNAVIQHTVAVAMDGDGGSGVGGDVPAEPKSSNTSKK